MPNQYFYEKQLPPNEPVEFQVERMDAGIVLEISNRDAPPESATDARNVRFETGGVKKDFGRRLLGAAGGGRILAIAEHRYISNNLVRARLVRLLHVDGELQLEVWSGAAWVPTATYPAINDVYLSVISTQNLLIMADGNRVLKWVETPDLNDVIQQFVAGEFLEHNEESSPITITPAGAVGAYTARFSTRFRQLLTSGGSVTVQVLKGEETVPEYHVVAEETFDLPAADPIVDPEVVVDREMKFFAQIQPGEEIKLRPVFDLEQVPDESPLVPVASGAAPNGPPRAASFSIYSPGGLKSINWLPGDLEASTEIGTSPTDTGGATAVLATVDPGLVSTSTFDVSNFFWVRHIIGANTTAWVLVEAAGTFMIDLAGEPQIEVEVTSTAIDEVGDPSDDYTFLLTFSVSTLLVFRFWHFDGVSWTNVHEETFDPDPDALESYIRKEVVVTIPGVAVGHFLGVSIAEMWPAESFIWIHDPAFPALKYGPYLHTGNFTESGGDIHPFNSVAGDPEHGLEYQVDAGTSTSLISLLGSGVPPARFVFPFGDRVISLRNLNDAQAIGASADGNIETWLGSDTADFSLLDTASDPIDDLMGGAHLGPGVAALFRKRSIHRVYETGNVELPIAVVKWLEQVGTESPFSIQLVERGIAFLGYDKMVYILTEQGHQPVSPWIHDELVEKLADADLSLVDSAYNSVTGEYYLGIPIGESASIEELWILDVKRMWLLQGQEQPWRRRPLTIGRLAGVSQL